jgi:hypothetical protein
MQRMKDSFLSVLFCVYFRLEQYVTLDDIMDLIGSGSLQSEEAMRAMWGKTLNNYNCRTTHITYEDFLLIMKGQTRECSDQPDAVTASTLVPRVASTGQLNVTTGILPVVQEEKESVIRAGEALPTHLRPITSAATPLTPLTPIISNQPAIDAPLSMDELDDMPLLGAGPMAPTYSPPPTISGRRTDIIGSPESQPDGVLADDFDVFGNQSNPDFVGIPPIPSIPRPSLYTRQKSKSMDESEINKSFDLPLSFPNNARRAVALPETDPEVRDSLEDKNISALQANRKLYRAHRHMRLSVMDACKRFEEQQHKHARDVLLAQKAKDGNTKSAAGLVMRRVENKTVTSEEVKQLLEKNLKEQQDLMEKANRRGGRGRRTRKKTISDMSGMMGSLTSEELTGISIQASTAGINSSERPPLSSQTENTAAAPIPPVIETRLYEEVEMESPETNLRAPTIPGDFRKVNDPFSGLL